MYQTQNKINKQTKLLLSSNNHNPDFQPVPDLFSNCKPQISEPLAAGTGHPRGRVPPPQEPRPLPPMEHGPSLGQPLSGRAQLRDDP